MTKKCECENIREKCFYAIQDNVDSIFELFQNLEICEDCKAFLSKAVSMCEALNEIPNVVNRTLPEIDVTADIFEKVKIIYEKETIVRELLEKEFYDPEEAEWMAFIENELDDVNKYRCLCKLNTSHEIQEEFIFVKKIHETLEKMGDDIQLPDLDEDLLPKVMNKIYSSPLEVSLDNFLKEEVVAQFGKDLGAVSERNGLPSKPQLRIERPGELVRPGGQKNSKEVLYNGSESKSPRGSSVKSVVRNVSLNRVIQGFAIAAGFLFVVLGGYYFLFRGNQVEPIHLSANGPSITYSKEESYKVIPPPSSDDNTLGISSEDSKDSDSKSIKKYTAKPLSEWEDILKENALSNAGKLMRMGVWASLTPEEARELLKKSGLSPVAILGAVQFLPPEEAKAILEAAIANNPEDAYLRFAMVNTLRSMGYVDYNELNAHLYAWTNSDPSNILPYYIEADIYLRNGEVELALNCVKEASSIRGYNSYAMLTAQAYKEALIAKGVDPELAQLLASASLGIRETQTLEDIARNLLDYGKYYEGIGDYSTALMIYEALRDLGINVDMSSALLQERLAGLKYAQEAVYALIRIMTQTYSFSDIQSYIAFLQNLNQLLENYNNALASFYSLFNTLDPQQILQLLNSYLSGGNANILGPTPTAQSKK
ncbi:MAG: hypothetical protein N3G21_07190 [Candidatus Hydrogenedentes bacterium]|nr:hypothetical protein [Candidatus Hydrogenedentota bacterium]